jgi:hypothetical protein
MKYPEHLLAREPAPPYHGEGPFALWHFSEDPSLGRFRPRAPAASPAARPLVWAVDTRHAPLFWFPRDCPRGCIWPVSATTPLDLRNSAPHPDIIPLPARPAVGYAGRMQQYQVTTTPEPSGARLLP